MKTVSGTTRGVGPSVMTVTVKSINAAKSEATCVEVLTTNEVVVFISPQRAKGGIPKVGETWLINRDFGRWSFAGVLGWVRPTVTGVKAGNTALTLSLLAALTDLGLITDATT